MGNSISTIVANFFFVGKPSLYVAIELICDDC